MQFFSALKKAFWLKNNFVSFVSAIAYFLNMQAILYFRYKILP